MNLFLFFVWCYGYTPQTTPWYWWAFLVFIFSINLIGVIKKHDQGKE